MRKYAGNSLRLETQCSRTCNTVFSYFDLRMKQDGIDCIDMNAETGLCKKVENDRKGYRECLQEKAVFRNEHGQEDYFDPALYNIDNVSCDGTKGSVILLRNIRNNEKTMAVRCEEYGVDKDGKPSCAASIGIGGCSQFDREMKRFVKG